MKTADGTTGKLDDIRFGESCEEYCSRHLAHAIAENNSIIAYLGKEGFITKLKNAYIIHKSKRSTMSKDQFISKLIEFNEEIASLDKEIHSLAKKSAELLRLQTLLIYEWGESENK